MVRENLWRQEKVFFFVRFAILTTIEKRRSQQGASPTSIYFFPCLVTVSSLRDQEDSPMYSLRRVRPIVGRQSVFHQRLPHQAFLVHWDPNGRYMATSSSSPPKEPKKSTYVGHNFPDFVEHWSRDAFYKVGYGLGTTTGILALFAINHGVYGIPAIAMGAVTSLYWKIGQDDMKQTNHAIRRNYPVLGNVRYLLETIRPEIRQYLVESDLDGKPYDRIRRSIIYQRAKNVDDTMAFGTRQDVYATNYEWACHSMWPRVVNLEDENAVRCNIGTASFGTTQPYSASVLNISAMSYGAISDNAILALSRGAFLGGFYHNTGEGGVSKSHKEGGGDLVWNMGAYFAGTSTLYRLFTFQSILSDFRVCYPRNGLLWMWYYGSPNGDENL